MFLICVHFRSHVCRILVQCGCAVLSDMPVMDEIVRDFKVAESSSESEQSVGRQVQVYLTSLLKHLILLIHNVSLFAAQFSATTRSSAPTEFV